MNKKELEDKCKKLEKIITDIQWMARRYAHGRQSYAVGMYNDAIKLAQELGMQFKPDAIDGLVEAKDAGLDKEWFEARKNNSVKFIMEVEPALKVEKNCGAWDDDGGC